MSVAGGASLRLQYVMIGLMAAAIDGVYADALGGVRRSNDSPNVEAGTADIRHRGSWIAARIIRGCRTTPRAGSGVPGENHPR